jgi:serine/threonine protein kinase
MITTYSMASDGRGFSFPQIHHPNFTDIYELYYTKDQVFVISEYLDFSLEDLLKHRIWPTETEIAYIISQVRLTDIILYPRFSN